MVLSSASRGKRIGREQCLICTGSHRLGQHIDASSVSISPDSEQFGSMSVMPDHIGAESRGDSLLEVQTRERFVLVQVGDVLVEGFSLR